MQAQLAASEIFRSAEEVVRDGYAVGLGIKGLDRRRPKVQLPRCIIGAGRDFAHLAQGTGNSEMLATRRMIIDEVEVDAREVSEIDALFGPFASERQAQSQALGICRHDEVIGRKSASGFNDLSDLGAPIYLSGVVRTQRGAG